MTQHFPFVPRALWGSAHHVIPTVILNHQGPDSSDKSEIVLYQALAFMGFQVSFVGILCGAKTSWLLSVCERRWLGYDKGFDSDGGEGATGHVICFTGDLKRS